MLKNYIEHLLFEMEKPPLFGTFHFISLALGLGLAVLAAFLCRKLNDKQERVLWFGIFLILAILDIHKQLIRTCLNGWHYYWHAFPMYLCSIPIYFSLFLAFLPKHSKVRDCIYTFLGSFNLMGGLGVLFLPLGIFKPYWVVSVMSMLYHAILVFVGLFLWMKGYAGKRPQDFVKALLLYLALALWAVGLNLALFEVSNGTIGCFHLGPRIIDSFLIISDIGKNVGWVSYSLCIMAFSIIMAFLTYLVGLNIRRKITNRWFNQNL